MATKKTTSKLPAKRASRVQTPLDRRVATRPAEGSAPAPADGMSAQMKSAAIGFLKLSKGVIGAARGLQLASSAARALGGGSPSKAAKLLLEAFGGAETSRAARGAAQAGTVLKRLREAAGFTLDEVSKALNLKEPALLGALESGKMALPFELILRMAAVIGRNDPIGFIMKLTRTANPDLWRSLEALGIGRLVLQSAREREFANIYRADDAARSLSDEDFAVMLAFVKASFEIAMAYRSRSHSGHCASP